MKVDNRCQTCGREADSINHLLFECCFARQVWAVSSIPHSRGGFDDSSIYANFNYLLNLNDLRHLSEEDKRVWPWILWNLWKRRNEMLFEEANEWYAAQAVEEEWSREEMISRPSTHHKWLPPEHQWVMCNVGMEFSKSKGLVGGAWVLRNERVLVPCHSRRAFSGIINRDDAKLVVILWGLESMRSQRQSKVIFAGEFGDLFGAVERSQAWPSFLYQVAQMRKELEGMSDWKLLVVTREANRGIFFIAQSVIKYGLVNSYVAKGYPPWLFEFFFNESRAL
ncbi:hypothetical protein Bca101_058399 [Brassica carinata]